jgi:hypothetical protein
MEIIAPIITQLLQGLALLAGDLSFTDKRRDQFHLRTQMSYHCHAPALPTPAFAFGGQIAHVRHYLARLPRVTLVAVKWRLGTNKPPSETLAGATQLTNGTSKTAG